jgi:hypothetical protein
VATVALQKAQVTIPGSPAGACNDNMFFKIIIIVVNKSNFPAKAQSSTLPAY